MDLMPSIQQFMPQTIKWRRHLHQNPELSFNEFNTSQFVFNTLNSFGNLIVTRPTTTSVMARLIGKKPGKVLALRADMDALPLTEQNSFDYKSCNVGVMHACGHDGHTASLLTVAKIVSELQNDINGEIRFLFQHAEELPPGGAVQMIAANVLENVDMIVGIHLWSKMPIGQIGVVRGPMMAATDSFDLDIIGKGGHGGNPHQAIDCIAIAAQVVTNLQQIISRQVDPLEPTVLSITKFIAGSTHNVLPGEVKISGTVRTLNNEVRQQVRESMERIIHGITLAHSATYKLNYVSGYNAVINNEKIVEQLEKVIAKELGSDFIYKMKPNMGGEDFAAFLEKVPGCFLFVGAGNIEKGIIHPHHHPEFNIDEDALEHSIKIFLGVIKEINICV